jgi:23S rRNA pseudouridine2457 synthase
MSMHRYFVINKPHDMVSQFVSSHRLRLLGELDFTFPEGTHAIGRLDKDSEGLLLLTTNKAITRLLFQGAVPHKRTYLVQAKGLVSDARLRQLEAGVTIPVKDGALYATRPCTARILDSPPVHFSSGYVLHERVSHTWLELELTEGKFHQVRKMMSAIGHPCKRLIRYSIEDLTLEDLLPGQVREEPESGFFQKLRLTT